jgi:hypothetical protein
VAYKAARGDCKVPKGWAEDPKLAFWVSNQRKCKQYLDRGDPSEGMTVERAAKMEALGFTWAFNHNGSKGGGSQPNDVAWEAQLARLAAYKAAHGDCNVRRAWAEDPQLAVWVNKQRTSKQKLDRGEAQPPRGSGITAARVAKLDTLGFFWVMIRGWEAQFARLAAYKVAHGDCNVPYCWTEDPGLATWVSGQRKGKKKLDRGEPSKGMTTARVTKLTALGFAWGFLGPRGPKKNGLV